MEPHDFGFEVLDRFVPPLEVVSEARYEAHSPYGMYPSLLDPVAYDAGDPAPRMGILSARLRKPG
jgi:hypothetical protein